MNVREQYRSLVEKEQIAFAKTEALDPLAQSNLIIRFTDLRERCCNLMAREEITLAIIKELEDAIRLHRSQKADDRCIFDDDKLYESLHDGIKCDRRVGSQCEMLKNCERFIKQRTEEGGWPTYAELEARIAELESENKCLREDLMGSDL